MFTALLVTAATAFSSLVAAQNYSTSGNISVVPDSVPYATRQTWCVGQLIACPQICGGRAFPNQCFEDTLTYQCTCTDGSHPNISSYTNTLPWFVCERWISDCVDAHPNDYLGIQACRSVICGTKNASANVATASSAPATTAMTSSSMSGSTTKTAAATTTSATPKTTSSGSAAVNNVGVNYGTGIVSAVLLGLFGLAL